MDIVLDHDHNDEIMPQKKFSFSFAFLAWFVMSIEYGHIHIDSIPYLTLVLSVEERMSVLLPFFLHLVASEPPIGLLVGCYKCICSKARQWIQYQYA